MDRTYNPSTYMDDISAIRESNKVNAEDIELLTKYIALSKMAGNNLEGKTYEEILERIKEIRQSNSDIGEQEQLQKQAARDRMLPFLKVNVTGKTFSNTDGNICTVVFQNMSSKNIKMVIGNISFHDLLDREIKTLQILLEEKLSPGGSLTKNYTLHHDQANENDNRFKSKELVDIRVEWNPVKIVFEDGTIAE